MRRSIWVVVTRVAARDHAGPTTHPDGLTDFVTPRSYCLCRLAGHRILLPANMAALHASAMNSMQKKVHRLEWRRLRAIQARKL